GDYAAMKPMIIELLALADDKGTPFWKAVGLMLQGRLFALTGEAANAVQKLTSGIALRRSTGSTVMLPAYTAYLAWAYAKLGQIGEARRVMGEAITMVQKTNERWFEAEIHRIAGDIALSVQPNAPKAEEYFNRALFVSREQQAKSLELRAAMSMA